MEVHGREMDNNVKIVLHVYNNAQRHERSSVEETESFFVRLGLQEIQVLDPYASAI